MILDERAGEVFVLVDALDECEESKRTDLLRSIKKLFQSFPEAAKGRFKFFITCRPEINDIEGGTVGAGISFRMGCGNINDDLSKYINLKVNDLGYPDPLRGNVRNALMHRAGGTFLWVSLMVADIKDTLMHEVEDKLKSLPNGLDDTYDQIFNRIPDGKRKTAQFILHCMVAAQRPLRKIEIEIAFATSKVGSIPPRQKLATYADIYKPGSSILYVGSSVVSVRKAYNTQS
jgi:hypothetical protein